MTRALRGQVVRCNTPASDYLDETQLSAVGVYVPEVEISLRARSMIKPALPQPSRAARLFGVRAHAFASDRLKNPNRLRSGLQLLSNGTALTL